MIFRKTSRTPRSIWLPADDLPSTYVCFVLYAPRALPSASSIERWLREHVHDSAVARDAADVSDAAIADMLVPDAWSVSVEVPGLGWAVYGDMGVRVPDDEASAAAANSYIHREEVVAAAREHTSHVVCVVRSERTGPDLFKLVAWVVAALCAKSPSATAVYAGGRLVTPTRLWLACAQMASEGVVPFAPFVFIGLARSREGPVLRTEGAANVGIRELEFRLGEHAPPHWTRIVEFLDYAFENRQGLDAGHTIGLTENGDVWPIAVGPSVLDDETVAIIGPPR